MRFSYLFLFHFLCRSFALTQDQIFQNDWQTINIGIPVAALEIDNRIITFTDIGIFSIINSTFGSVMYRYQTEVLPVSINSGLVGSTSNNEQVLNFINFESNSKLLVWNIARNHGIIEKEYNFENNIIAVISNTDHIYVVEEKSIVNIDLKTNTQNIIYTTSNSISSAKLFASTVDQLIYVIFDINGDVYFSDLLDFHLKPFSDCSVDNTRFKQSASNLLICSNSNVFAFDSISSIKISTGKNMVDEKLSADSLLPSELQSFDVINNKEILAFSENSVNLFNSESLSFTPEAISEIPIAYYDSYYNNFHISRSKNVTDINLFLVTPLAVLEYYKNGQLLWSSDQSFVDIKDFVIIDTALKSSLTFTELIYDTSSNIFVSFFRRLRHNYNSIFGKSKFALDNINRFGMSKKIIVLSNNGKLAVYQMYKSESSNSPQMIAVFNPPVKLTKLYEIDKNIYALSENNSIFEIDIQLGKIHQISSEFRASNFVDIVKSENEIETITTPTIETEEFYTTSFFELTNTIRGHLFNSKGQFDLWKFSRENEKIISLTRRSYGNLVVAQNALVLPDRSIIYKYLIPNIGIITTSKETVGEKSIILYIVNLITGQIYGRFEKEIGLTTDVENEVHISFEENFIILTTPDKFSKLDTQICSIDLFESLKPDKSFTKGFSSYSPFDNAILPAFASQCFILPGIIVDAVSISNTKHNIATKNIIIRTNLGQIIALPKMVIDGRRNGLIGDFKNILNFESSVALLDDNRTSVLSPSVQRINNNAYAASIASRFTYDPIININPQFILTHHRKMISTKYVNDGKRDLLTNPTELESTTYVLSVEGDIFVTFLRTSGSFDRLTSSFNTKVVIITLIVLFLGIAFVRPKTEKIKLLGKWIL